jgi:MFS family permease
VDLSRLGLLLRRRSVICITISYAAYGYFQYLFFYWITYYFETIRHEDKSVSRWYSTVITLAMGVGMIGGGWLADHVPRSFSPWARRAFVPIVGMFAAGGVFELGILGGTPQTTLLAFAVAAALIGACEGAFWTTAVELGGSLGGTAAGMLNTGGNAGGALSPYLTPLLSGFFTKLYGAEVGWRLGLAVAGGIVALGGLLWWGVDPAENANASCSDPEPAQG